METETVTVSPPNFSETDTALALIKHRFTSLTGPDTNSDYAALRRAREGFAVECINISNRIAEWGKYALYLNYRDGLWRDAIDPSTGEPYKAGIKYVTDFWTENVEEIQRRSMYGDFSKYRLLDDIGVAQAATLRIVATAPTSLGVLLNDTVVTNSAGGFVRIADGKRELIEAQLEQVAGVEPHEVAQLTDRNLLGQFVEVLSEMDKRQVGAVKNAITRRVTVRLTWLPAERMVRWSVKRANGKPVVFYMRAENSSKTELSDPDVKEVLRKLMDGRYLNVG